MDKEENKIETNKSQSPEKSSEPALPTDSRNSERRANDQNRRPNNRNDRNPRSKQFKKPMDKPERTDRPERTEKSALKEKPLESDNKSLPKKKNINNNPRFSKRPLITVVIPTFNEEESITELSSILEKVLNRETKNNYEVLFVDDGSTDNSFSVMKEINQKNNKFKAIRFRRNYGKSAALSVAFKAAKGAVIITMDADLQDDPNEIPNLMNKIREGYDVVSGWKKKRNDPINKTLPSKLFNYVTAKASGLKLHDFNCGLKAYRSEAAKSLDIYGEMHRYLPVLAHWNGFRIAEIPVQHHPRKHGKTKFGASRYVKGFLDLLTLLFTSRYLKRPLHFFGTIGTLMALVGFSIDAWLTIEWIMGDTFLSNRPIALLGIALIIVGVQLVSLGLLGEMIVKNFKRDEEYQIRENI